MMWVSKREWTAINAQLEYWRGKFEDEQRRADAAVDQALAEAGRQPIGTAAVERGRLTAEQMKAQAEEVAVRIAEANVDDDGSQFISEEGFMTLAVEGSK